MTNRSNESNRTENEDIPEEFRPFLEWLASFPHPRIERALRQLEAEEPGEGWGEAADIMKRNREKREQAQP